MNEKLPEPYSSSPESHISPFTLRCDEIDAAAMLIIDPEAFAEAARGDRELDPEADIRSDAHAFYEKPDGPYIRHFTEEGGCPAFRGILNAGSTANVLCDLTRVQLHVYCEEKFCKNGRKVYCPIWVGRSYDELRLEPSEGKIENKRQLAENDEACRERLKR